MNARRQRIVLAACMLWAAVAGTAAVLGVPDDHRTVQAAVDAAKPGDTVRIAAGTFVGNVRVDKPILLSGAGRDRTTLKAEKGHVVLVSARVTLEHVTVQGGATCVYARKGAAVTVRHCRIADGRKGIHFDGDFNTTAVVHHCELLRCGDAIDLESTQAILHDNVFRDNRDDAIDFDGDAGGIVFRNTIVNCRDDGIEIRLRRITQAVIVDNTFDGCGEDGLELIDSTVKGTSHNLVVVAGNTFRNCTRFGVGAVDQKTEQAADAMVQAGLFGERNTFDHCGKADLSPNLGPVDLRAGRTDEKVTVQTTVAGNTTSRELPVQWLTPVAIYDLQHDPQGKHVSDAEGVEVDPESARALIGDDNARAIWSLDLRTAQLVGKLPTNPFPGSDTRITGPEGFAFDPEDRTRMWLAGDDDKTVVVFSLAKASFGQILATRGTKACHGYPEGVAHAGERVYFVGGKALAAGDRTTLERCPGFPVSYRFEGYGSHVAGIAFDGKQLLMTASGYGGKTKFNEKGLLVAADPATGQVSAAWSLGRYSSDPRGVAVAGGLVFVCDGYGTPTLPGGKVPNRQGLKLFVFATGKVDDLGALLRWLPLRRRTAAEKEEAP